MEGVNPVDVLTVEHEVVRRYVETLESAARCLRRGDLLPGSHLDGLLQLSRDFVEDFHHTKEEGRLFPMLVGMRGDLLRDHVLVLSRQHREGHARIAAISAAKEAYLAGEQDAREVLASQLQGYAELLRRHAHREDNVLFPLARQLLGEEDNRRIVEAFRDEEAGFPQDFLRNCVARLRELRNELRELSQVRQGPRL